MAPPRKAPKTEPTTRRRPPATTPEAREQQLISLAYDLAEKQLLDGTASSAVISQLLKAGTARDNLERKKIEMEIALGKTKQDSMASQAESQDMYEKALKAFKGYSGQDEEDDGYYD